MAEENNQEVKNSGGGKGLIIVLIALVVMEVISYILKEYFPEIMLLQLKKFKKQKQVIRVIHLKQILMIWF